MEPADIYFATFVDSANRAPCRGRQPSTESRKKKRCKNRWSPLMHLHSRKRARPSFCFSTTSDVLNKIGLPQRCLFSFGAAHEPGPPRAQNFEQICVHVQNPAPKPNLMLPRRSSARSMQKPVRCFICTGWHAPMWRRQRCLEMFGETFITGLKKTSYIGLRLQRVEHWCKRCGALHVEGCVFVSYFLPKCFNEDWRGRVRWTDLVLTQHVLQRSVMICCQLSVAFCPWNRWKWLCGVLPGTASVWTFSLSAGCGYAAIWSNTRATAPEAVEGKFAMVMVGAGKFANMQSTSKHLTVSLYSCSCLYTSHITTSLFQAVLPGMEVLYVVWWDLGGWARRCGKLFRDLPCKHRC